jgi:hypothetical protein
MKITLNFDPDLRALMAAEALAGEKAVTRSMRSAATAVKQDWRDQITRAGLGTRLPRTIRSRAYPETGESIDAAALIWSNAPEIVGAFDRGVTIRSKDGFWLAVPLPGAGSRLQGGRKLTPARWEQRTGKKLTYIYRRGKAPLLVDTGQARERGYNDPLTFKASRRRYRQNVWTPIFVLLPQVRLRKRLDLSSGVTGVLNRLPQMIVDDWARQPARVRNA